MHKTVNIYEAKTHFSALIAEAMAGDDIVIARNGEPCVRLVPVRSPERVPMGFLARPAESDDVFPSTMDEQDLDRWEAEWKAEWDAFYPK